MRLIHAARSDDCFGCFCDGLCYRAGRVEKRTSTSHFGVAKTEPDVAKTPGCSVPGKSQEIRTSISGAPSAARTKGSCVNLVQATEGLLFQTTALWMLSDKQQGT